MALKLLQQRWSSGRSSIKFLKSCRSYTSRKAPHRPHLSLLRIFSQDSLDEPSGVVDLSIGRDFSCKTRTIWDEHRRCMHSGAHEGDSSPPAKCRKLVLYRAKWIRPIRLLVRLKLIQLSGVVALTIPLAEYSQQGSLSLGTTLAVGAVVGGAGAASVALWYYSRRLVGEMALVIPDLRTVQISVLDFWGNRQDLQYDIRDIVPPLKGMSREELEKAAQQIVIPLDVIGDRQFFLSLRHGHLIRKGILFSLLNGSVGETDLTNMNSAP